MDISHITSQSLLHLLSLAEKKDALIKAIEEVNAEIARTVKGGAISVVEAIEVVRPPQPKAVAPAKVKAAPAAPKKSKDAGRAGGLKDRVLALLEAAGAQGLRVKEIADKLGIKATNISVWFSTTGKNHTNRLEPGRYAAKGTKTVAAVPNKVEAPVKPAKAAKVANAKRKMTPEARARIGAAATARWAAVRAGKAAAKPAAKPVAPTKAPAKKGFRLAKYK